MLRNVIQRILRLHTIIRNKHLLNKVNVKSDCILKDRKR